MHKESCHWGALARSNLCYDGHSEQGEESHRFASFGLATSASLSFAMASACQGISYVYYKFMPTVLQYGNLWKERKEEFEAGKLTGKNVIIKIVDRRRYRRNFLYRCVFVSVSIVA
ncbi:MAG: hypothetical protein CV087_04120 [Candidatus Brocadia sp. WS118]|nr:MAG: hypothetical protein CV087_04120 [Candidatus Brocadia sp. WS118]